MGMLMIKGTLTLDIDFGHDLCLFVIFGETHLPVTIPGF